MVYLDSAATTQISDEVLEEMVPWLKAKYGNPGALYHIGREAAAAVDTARERAALLLCCSPDQVIFTSGGSEGNNLVIKGVLPHLSINGRHHIITSAIEHDSVLHAVRDVIRIKPEFHKRIIPPCHLGYVDSRDFANALEEEPVGLASIMYVNNETGAVNDVAWMGELCHRHGGLFHSDCVQAAGCFQLDTIKPHCDFITVSSHKIHGPKGVGAIYAADASILTPLISGGSHQEHGLRGGTENVPGIVGFGKACELAAKDIELRAKRITELKTAFFNALNAQLLVNGFCNQVKVNGVYPDARGKVLSLRFEAIDAQTLLLALEHDGICCSAGSACTSHDNKPSHVLTAMGITEADARSTLRFSFDASLTEEDVCHAAKIVACIYHLIRDGSL